eukprot:TRINITY_DN9383_c0_g1_i1.p1 TRINITY_DN9383_c0_g1~~TRINITY_DN9383_c0_g1_i1.p1  ORF type:complete len:355 (-),score=58.02 TRINITY_DN9383_c0_g1_i1:264-1328(-)
MFLSSFGSDPSRPSFFEMAAQQEMMPALRPAFRFTLATLAQRHSSVIRIAQRSDLIFNIILFLLENHHLRHYDASFSENFYGLRRMRLTKQSHQRRKFEPIDMKRRYTALLFLVVIPSIKRFLDEKFKELSVRRLVARNRAAPEETNMNPAKKWALKLFMLLYPYFNVAYEGSFFVYQLLYLYDQTDYYSPFHHLQGITLKRLSPKEMEAQLAEIAAERGERLRKMTGGPLPRLGRYILHFYDLVVDYSKLLLPITIFSYKFLEWWYHENSRLTPEIPIPPAPKPLPKAEMGLRLPDDPRLCPICQQDRKNAAAIPTGYVFCYPCIFTYVQDHGKCPITLVPADLDSIRRIYES